MSWKGDCLIVHWFLCCFWFLMSFFWFFLVFCRSTPKPYNWYWKSAFYWVYWGNLNAPNGWLSNSLFWWWFCHFSFQSLTLIDWEVLELFLNKYKYTYNESLSSDISSALTLFFKKFTEFIFSSSVEYSVFVKSVFKFKDRFFSLLKLNSADDSDQSVCKCRCHNELSLHMINKCRIKCKMNQIIKKKWKQIVKHLFKKQVHNKFIDKDRKMYWKMSHTLLNSIKCLHIAFSDNFISVFFTASSHSNLSDMLNLNNKLTDL